MTARAIALLALALLPAAAAVQAGNVPAAHSVLARGTAGPPGSHPRPSLSVAYEPENPPAARTGGFGEPTCQECHFESDVNAGTGTIEVALPDFVLPDTTYHITVQLTHPGMRRAGFMLSTRTPHGGQAGRLRATDERTTTTAAGDVVYVHHALGGTWVEGDSQSWTFEWTTDGLLQGAVVVVHVAANAGNNDASPFGDYVYAGEWVIGR